MTSLSSFSFYKDVAFSQASAPERIKIYILYKSYIYYTRAAASIWFEIWRVVDPGKKIRFFQTKNQFFRANFLKISIF